VQINWQIVQFDGDAHSAHSCNRKKKKNPKTVEKEREKKERNDVLKMMALWSGDY